MRGLSAAGRRPAFLAFLAVTGLCLVGLWLAFAPMAPWLTTPIGYEGDGLWNLFVAKTTIETGWYGWNDRLGAPFGATYLDFPKPEILFLGFFRLVGVCGGSPFLANNLLFFLGFVATAWSALWTLRRHFSIDWPLAVAGGVVFAFIPFHVIRVGHLFLGVSIAVPLAVGLAISVASSIPPFFEEGSIRLAKREVWIAAAVVAATSSYWVYFAVLLVGFSGLIETLRRRRFRPFVSALFVVGLLGALSAVNLSPSLWHRIQGGRNTEVLDRAPASSEDLSLRPIHLILPTQNHRIPLLGAAALRFNSLAPAINENRTATLGLLGTAGFVLLLTRLVVGVRRGEESSPLATAARLNAVALAIGVTGGLGTAVAFFVTPLYRATNRISVFIAFLSIAALLSAIQGRVRSSRRSGFVAVAVCLALAVIGWWDQVPVRTRPDSSRIAARFESDRAFVQRLESAWPEATAVWQFPYSRNPEPSRDEPVPPYDQMRPYLHSSRFRWSYGEVRGRPGDLWERAISQLPMEKLYDVVRASGFDVICLDRSGLADRGAEWARFLVSRGIDSAIASDDGSFIAFRLPDHPPLPVRYDSLEPFPMSGFDAWEGSGPSRWMWSNGDASFRFPVAAGRPFRGRFQASLGTITAREVTFSAGGTTLLRIALEPDRWTPVSVEFEIDPLVELRLETDRPPSPPSGSDSRALAFCVRSPLVVETGAVAKPGASAIAR